MREIPLSKGYVALVDDEDYEALSKHRWYAGPTPRSTAIYAKRHEMRLGKNRSILMHREIMGLVGGPPPIVDHINRNSLDNRRANLRLATPSQSKSNTKMDHRNKSGFRGVYKMPNGTFCAKRTINLKSIHLGTFATAELASAAYEKSARAAVGDFVGPLNLAS